MEQIYNTTISAHIADLSQYRINSILPENLSCSTGGRILTLRTYRNILFFGLYEDGQYIQCSIRNSANPNAFDYFNNNISRGNIVIVNGVWDRTSSGEVTLFVNQIQLISSNLEPISDLYDGFNAVEGRQIRELDIMLNIDSMTRFRQRSQVIWTLRNLLHELNFIEVETPILQTVASGAQATPFITNINAINQAAYLRIAPEIYLVRLLTGGMSRIFEIGHTFRNEGLSSRHNPEFSMIEFYETFSNLNETINLTQSIIQNCIRVVHNDISQVSYGEHILNFNQFNIYSLSQSLIEFLGYSIENVNNRDFLEQEIINHRINNTMPSNNIPWLQYLLFQDLVEHLLIQPTFISDLPIEASPLAYSSNGETTHRFELFIAGRELANGFEQNIDYEEQISRFEFQSNIAGRENAMESDLEYLTSVRYGLPTISGCGIGLDRLIMLITNTMHIRDVILYPI